MSQASTVLPTTGTITGLAEQGLINGALAALLSNNSGGSAPASPTTLQFWADTSVSGYVTLRQYTGSAWQAIWTLDLSTGELSFAASSPQNWVAASGTHDAITATYDPPATALVDGMVSNFRATAANLTPTPTFNRDSLGALTITKNGGAALAIGDIPGNLAEVQLRYNLANTRWELLNPPAVPVGGIVPYFGGTLPSGYALPQGQNYSATTYPAANAVLGTTYGNPGGGNFTMPDLRGMTMAALDAGGSNRLANVFGSTALGGTGGSQTQVLLQANLPVVNFTLNLTDPGHTHPPVHGDFMDGVGSGGTNTYAAGAGQTDFDSTTGSARTGITGTAASGGSASPVVTVQPTMVLNVMMRIN